METINKHKKGRVLQQSQRLLQTCRRNQKQERGRLFLTSSSGIWTGYSICRLGEIDKNSCARQKKKENQAEAKHVVNICIHTAHREHNSCHFLWYYHMLHLVKMHHLFSIWFHSKVLFYLIIKKGGYFERTGFLVLRKQPLKMAPSSILGSLALAVG